MNKSRLIQRLRKPVKIKNPTTVCEKFIVHNPFAFGGGLKNGGFSDEAMNLLKDIFQFDYMGAAEFEFGAVPEALQIIAKAKKDYIAFQIPKVKYKYSDYRGGVVLTGTNPVYIICRKDWKEEVTTRIKAKALGDHGRHKNNFDTKGAVFLNESLTRADVRGTMGWLELDNGYFFFTDKEMFANVCELFKLKEEPLV